MASRSFLSFSTQEDFDKCRICNKDFNSKEKLSVVTEKDWGRFSDQAKKWNSFDFT